MNRLKFRLLGLQGVIYSILLVSLPGCMPFSQTPVRSTQIVAANNLPKQKHTFASIPFEAQAQNIAQLLQQKKFSEVERIMADHIERRTSTRGGSYYPDAVLLSLFYGGIIELDQQFLQTLNQWVEASPQSSLALIVRSQFYYAYAWKARGNRYVSKTPQEAQAEYGRRLSKSIQDLTKAEEFDPSNPLLLLSILELAKDISMDREVFEEYFTAATDEIPYVFQAYQSKQIYLLPEWHGSEKELLAFVRESAASTPRGSAVPLNVIQAHRSLSKKYPSKKDYYNRKDVWAEVVQNYTRLVEDFPEAGMYAAWFAEAAAQAGKRELAQQNLKIALEREPNHSEVQRIAAQIGIQ